MGDAGWVAVVAGIAIALVAVDRWMARRPSGPRPRRPRSWGHGGGAGALGEVIGLYQPGARFLQEEQQRQRHDLHLTGDAAPPWEIDLDGGTARIAAAPGADARPGGVQRLEPVAPGVWVATAERWTSTTTVVVAEDGQCLVVDPGITVAEVEALAAEIEARGWRPVAGFSTHPHWDHVLWSARLGDVPRWSTAVAARVAAASHPALARDADAEAPGHDHRLTGQLTALPEATGSSPGSRLPWDGPAAVAVPSSAHCAGSAVLVLPASGVLLAGDLLSDEEVPLLDLQAADPVGDHLRTLDMVESLVAGHGIGTLVPGHGTLARGPEITRRVAADRRYLTALATGDDVHDDRLGSAEVRGLHEEQRRALRAP